MATRAVRFTKAERELVRRLINGSGYSADAKVALSILTKLDLSELPVKSSGPSVNDAVQAFRGVLGARLVAPSQAAIGVISQMKARISALGLTVEDCRRAAEVAAVEWKGLIRAESLVRNADVLLARANGQGSASAPLPRNDAQPLELDEDDI